ncbi:PAS domain S-box-containing protein [Archangium gephyra]|uniref:histidine kinase n=1 Tax=Archangium gephyra TaxID=48 RepID=A0AAC8TJI3_9BACT|nr:PAS domain-containing protein [Archangium gephyra]AKJ06706.1 Chemotaxis protein methyltransferase CheR [Archangium gephyra]REG31990.1 PAS domain S-box-containing protein [Archangium gephyra]
MTTVAEFIERNREQLIERYVAEVGTWEPARGLGPYELTDTFPEYLSTLAAISRQGHRGDPVKTKSRLEGTHISLRMRVGFNQEEVTDEYVLMGRLISGLWEGLPLEQQPAQEDTRLLFEELQDAMGQVIVSFSGYSQEDRQREKRFLHRLNTLASEVMGDGEHFLPLHERLEPLLEVVREAMRAQGIALLLASPDGRTLLPTMYTGQWNMRTETEPIAVDGPGFVARLAASEEPLELPDAAGAGHAVSEGVRLSGLHSLLGVRLWPHGKLLGVLYLGVAEIRPFEPQARRYLETLVEYLSGIIQKALLLQQLQQANERLRRSETLHRLATAAISDAVWEWNLQTDTLAWSGGVQTLFGRTPEQLGGHISGWYDHIHPEDRERVVHGIHETIAGGGQRWRDEYRYLHGDGGYVHVIDHGLIERDASGKAVRMVGAMQDITARKSASEALRASEDRLRLAVRAAELGTWDFNPVTGLLRWDERCKALFGLPLEPEVTYEGFLAAIHPEDRDRAHAAVQLALQPASGGEYDIEFRPVGHKGRAVRWVRAIGRAYFEGGRAVRFIGTAQDISERKHQQQESQKRAEFAEQLIGIVSHDLRNPLNAITLSVAALMRQEELGERQAKGLARISAATERATRLIHDLLDFTRARLGGGIPIERKPLDLHTHCRQVVEEVRLAHPDREVEVVRSGEGRGEWDGDRLAQVITNLVNNALAYSPPGTPVRVETRGVDGTVLLGVHNEGRPIPPELLPHLFEPMTRGRPGGDTASRSIGLGLFIVANIVHAHGGTIDVHSEAATGTTFTVRLPRLASSSGK